ncbi:MAG TPA: MFS transporter [Stellaceae bacterium]|nr:MFS transporter [Stellaceae bacterium]
MQRTTAAVAKPVSVESTAVKILAALAFCHFLNDMMQSLVPALYPVLQEKFALNFSQIGLITLTYQITASLLQPAIGLYTDHRPKAYALPVGMAFTFAGLLMLSMASSFHFLLGASALAGVGSAIFHPEASRFARSASGGRHGFAQAFFQVGGAIGSATGPLLVAFFVLARGIGSVAWFSIAALVAILVLLPVGSWYQRHGVARNRVPPHGVGSGMALSQRQVTVSLAVLMILVFSKFFYLSSLTSYYTFYLIQRFGVSMQSAQIHLFVFLGALAIGTLVGGPLGDRFGRKYVIWGSIVGVLPFTLLLPYVGLEWTGILTVVIGLILSSAFSAIVVFAQELVPGKVGMISGLFFGLAFGMSGVGAAVLGVVADYTSIDFVYRLCAFLPAIGLITALLPNIEPPRRRRAS